jgi:uncharacterized membrane protein
MMMLFNSARNRKIVIGVMVALMAARITVFVLGAVGVLTWGSSGGGASWLPFVMVPIMVIVVMLMLGRRGMMHHMMSGSAETPLELLQKRFVRGELTSDEYEKMKRALLDNPREQQRQE